jgi:dTMP kinase
LRIASAPASSRRSRADLHDIRAEAEVFLFMAARAQHVRETILPALRDDRPVLCDRFSDATVAYQGFGRGLDVDVIRKMNDFATASLAPSLTILFDLRPSGKRNTGRRSL